MKYTPRTTRFAIVAVAALGLALAATPSRAAEYNLRAAATSVSILGAPTTMWGFACDSAIAPAVCPSVGVVTVPGPRLVVPPGDTTLTVNLTNDLADAVSIVIPGQALPAVTGGIASGTTIDAEGRTRITSFIGQAAGGGGTATFTWTNLKPGTYLYQSGSDVAKQVPMGMYGAVTADVAAGTAYNGVDYDSEVVLIFSEVDPALHAAEAFTNAVNYDPRYFLVNGQPFSAAAAPIAAGSAGQRILVRMLNAGLRSFVPEFPTTYVDLVAEDGGLFTASDSAGITEAATRRQYTVLLTAGKTADAIWVPATAGTYAVFDRRLHVTDNGISDGGAFARLAVSASAATAAADLFAATEDTVLSVAAPGVLGNDDAGTVRTVALVSGPSAGTLSCPTDAALQLCADGSFDYTPLADFNGSDTFTYSATIDGALTNAATATIEVASVNDAPVAAADAYSVASGTELQVMAPGVLANDSDVDGDALTAVLDSGPAGLILNPDGSFAYTDTASYAFTYHAWDGAAASAPVSVSVTITVPDNLAPVAVDDFAYTIKNTSVTLGLLGNDSDADGSLVPSSVVVIGQNGAGVFTTSQGGTVLNNGNGSVTFSPKKNFRGTDSFSYTVNDNLGDTSNVAVVRINVTK